MSVPFFRPSITEQEIEAVLRSVRSGWLTTGPRVKDFEATFAATVGAKHAVALNSCTAALHLALEALGVERGDGVLVPSMTFAATAEVVRYFDAVPIFVDCDPVTLCPDPVSMRAALEALQAGRGWPGVPEGTRPPKVMVVMHYGGQVGDMGAYRRLARDHGLRIVEDAAHTMPAWFRAEPGAAWEQVGAASLVTCFSFYANKCITTGEGGMATTDDDALADRMRLMSLHGMDRDAWKRYTDQGSWYYEVIAPGFKYNMTDLAAALGGAQLARHRDLWEQRREVAARLSAALRDLPLDLPSSSPDRKHSWHLFSIRLKLEEVSIGRDQLLEELRSRSIGHSVHWQPLHMMPYYRERYGLRPDDFPVAASLWPRLASLPIFAGMTDLEIDEVTTAVREILTRTRRA